MNLLEIIPIDLLKLIAKFLDYESLGIFLLLNKKINQICDNLAKPLRENYNKRKNLLILIIDRLKNGRKNRDKKIVFGKKIDNEIIIIRIRVEKESNNLIYVKQRHPYFHCKNPILSNTGYTCFRTGVNHNLIYHINMDNIFLLKRLVKNLIDQEYIILGKKKILH